MTYKDVHNGFHEQQCYPERRSVASALPGSTMHQKKQGRREDVLILVDAQLYHSKSQGPPFYLSASVTRAARSQDS